MAEGNYLYHPPRLDLLLARLGNENLDSTNTIDYVNPFVVRTAPFTKSQPPPTPHKTPHPFPIPSVQVHGYFGLKREKVNMKDCEKLRAYTTENRKAFLENQNRLIKSKSKTPESSLLGSGVFSNDLSLESLSLKTESEDVVETTLQNASSRKPSEILYECIYSNLSEKDKKILRLMAARREAKMEGDELALSAKRIWEKDRKGRAKKVEERKKALMEYLNRKHQLEQFEMLMRRNERNEALEQEKMALEMKIKEKHERAERRQKNLLEKRLKPETFAKKSQELFHQELKKQIEIGEAMETALHLKSFKNKERKSQEKLKRIRLERCRKAKEESFKRDLKWEAAKNFREEQNKRYEQEQKANLKRYEKSQQLREQRLAWTTERKRKMAIEKNLIKKQQHDLIFTKLKEEEAERLERARKKIQAEDAKTKMFRENRDNAITRSRFNARTTAVLREKMRSSYEL